MTLPLHVSRLKDTRCTRIAPTPLAGFQLLRDADTPVGNVPEPSGLALAGLGLLVLSGRGCIGTGKARQAGH